MRLTTWKLGRTRSASKPSEDCAASMADCLPQPAECTQGRRETAPNPNEPFSEDGAHLATTTPEREDEGKRRRLSSEVGCTAGGVAEEGAGGAAAECSTDSRTSSGTCSASSSATNLDEDEEHPRPLSKGVEDMLRSYLASWGQRLVQLQPKVHMTDHLIECGMYLFKYLRQLQVEAAYEGKFPLQYLANEQMLIHDLVSCWWISLKHASVRTAVPNRTLMCRATGALPELLSDRELAALIAIDWEVQAVLKKGNLVL